MEGEEHTILDRDGRLTATPRRAVPLERDEEPPELRSKLSEVELWIRDRSGGVRRSDFVQLERASDAHACCSPDREPVNLTVNMIDPQSTTPGNAKEGGAPDVAPVHGEQEDRLDGGELRLGGPLGERESSFGRGDPEIELS